MFKVLCKSDNVVMGIFLNVETRSADSLILVWFVDKDGKINSVPRNDVILDVHHTMFLKK